MLFALTVRRPETFCLFLEAAGNASSTLTAFPIHAGTEQLFVVTTLYSTVVKKEIGKRDSCPEQEIVIIQLDLRD